MTDAADTSAESAGSPDLVGRLSPSRASDFMTCPLLYRFRTIDRLPEPASKAMAKGTLVHLVLERLFDAHHDERTLDHAHGLVAGAWDELADRPEYAEILPTLEVDDWLRSTQDLITRYFQMEDPRAVSPTHREAPVEFQVADDLVLRGLVDRIDVHPNGDTVIVDYKTGKAPSPQYEQKAMFQMRFYALVLWRTTGVLPMSLRLMYLADGQSLVDTPNADDLLATQRKVLALWEAIRSAHAKEDFRPRPSALCKWCNFAHLCPSHDGTPPPFPQPRT